MSNDLRSVQQQVHLFCQAHGLLSSAEYRLIDLQSELGELGKELLKASAYGGEPFRTTDAFSRELGDVLFSLLCLANAAQVDVQDALQKVLQKYERRLRNGGAGSEHD